MPVTSQSPRAMGCRLPLPEIRIRDTDEGKAAAERLQSLKELTTEHMDTALEIARER